jgi:putative methionine-R-sulfoxide reductase with GAF domain
MEMVAEQAGKAFDPEVVRILQNSYIELEQLARSSDLEEFRLSTDIKIERGAAPDAGFEQASDSRPVAVEAARPAEGWTELTQVIEGMSGILARRDVLAILASRLQDLIPFDGLAVYARRGAKLVPEYASGAQVEILRSSEIQVGEGLSGWVARNNRAILNGNPAVDLGEAAGLKSALAIPLEADRVITGVFILFRTKADAFSTADLRQIALLSSILAHSAGRQQDTQLWSLPECHAPSALDGVLLRNTKSLVSA